jgi:fructoselysine-6-P-deglycase FrlB-like protein
MQARFTSSIRRANLLNGRYHVMSDGIAQLRAEMARQHVDALASLEAAQDLAGGIADTLRTRGRLALIGMGGSHWVNRAACPHYVGAGLDATAHVASEYLRAPLPGPLAMLVTSQSGNSGEILRLFDGRLVSDAAWGLTLTPEGGLARALPCLVGAGGPEKAYAATRSLLVTLAQHAAILDALGEDMTKALTALAEPAAVDTAEREAAIEHLAARRVAVMVARGGDQGVMDAAALCLMEIARIPVLGLEAGQFRHGPFEMIDGDTAVVFLRGQGAAEDDIAPLARETVSHGITPVVFDASGGTAISDTLTVTLPPARGMALALAALPVIQDILVYAAAKMLPDAGVPRRSTKVTSGEAA